MPDSEAKKNWIKNNTFTFSIRLNRNTDAAIINFIENHPNRAGLIKQLLRDHIKADR